MNNNHGDELGWQKRGCVLGAKFGAIELWEHSEPGYSKRTSDNAKCDVTMATAADYSTGGERMTKQFAGNRYIPLPLFLDADEAGRRLAEFMQKLGARSLNVAGNGIATLSVKHWTQEAVNQWIYECIATAHAIRPIERIQSGGQTGIDMSGAIAAHRLGIPAKILFPQGYKQRGEDSRDKPRQVLELISEIEASSAALAPFPRPPTAAPRP